MIVIFVVRVVGFVLLARVELVQNNGLYDKIYHMSDTSDMHVGRIGMSQPYKRQGSDGPTRK